MQRQLLRSTMPRVAVALLAALLTTGLFVTPAAAATGASAGAVPDAPCAAGSSPETGLQGQVPLADRQDGRSQQGYSCNLSLVGQYQGTGASWVNPSYQHCAYLSATFPSDLTSSQNGVRVVDNSDPAHPKLTAVLTSPAMQSGTWESLKVDAARGLLAAVSGGAVLGAGFFDVYDISTDCAHPKLLNGFASTDLTLPANGLGHEGGWAPDGKTYYAAGVLGDFTAIDVSDPAHPHILWTGLPNLLNHGFSLSPDGDYLYLSSLVNGAGMDIFDVSSIQNRSATPQVGYVGGVSWSDGLATQATVPITYQGKPYVIAWDELGNGGVRFIDVSDPHKPTIASQIRLAVNLPQNQTAVANDTSGDGFFGYQTHYCSVDRQTDPTALACGWFQSGVRVFDIRNIFAPREIAYYNPPAQVGKNSQLTDSEHANGTTALFGLEPNQLNADWCSSPPEFVGNELWVTCMDNGFMTLKFAPTAYPLS